MGKQNDALVAYLNREEILADLYNGCLCGGKQVVTVKTLGEAQRVYRGHAQERAQPRGERRRERDIIRVFHDGDTLVFLAVEAQNDPHLAMPFRCMEYDTLEYARQLRELKRENEGQLRGGTEYLSGMKRTDRLIPVITIVLYHGEKPWNAPRKLSEMMELGKLNPALKELFQEYQIHIFSVSELNEELFQTHLRELIGLMKCRRDKEAMQRYCRKHADRISKMDSATYDMVCTMLNLDTLQEKKEEYKNREEQEKYDMCKAMEEWAAESREEGRMIGLAEGEKKGRESGLMEGEKLGEQQLASLIGKLLQTGRQEDLQQALVDADARKRLYREFGI